MLHGHFQYIMDNAIPSGGPFVPIVQTQLAKTLAKLDSNLLAQINVGEVMSILEDDVVRMNDSINAVFLAIQTVTVVRALFIRKTYQTIVAHIVSTTLEESSEPSTVT